MVVQIINLRCSSSKNIKNTICWKVYFIFQHKEVIFVLRKKNLKKKLYTFFNAESAKKSLKYYLLKTKSSSYL